MTKSKSAGLMVAATAFTMIVVQGSDAAEIKRVNRSACNFLLSGGIVQGDLERFKASGISSGDSLCLSSDGGDYHVGLDIAEALLGENIRTVVDKDEACYSSCANIFMGGSLMEEGYQPLRSMHLRATLGFHAPYIEPSERNYASGHVRFAYASGLKAVARMMKLGNGVIPNRVILDLLEKGPSEFYTIDTVGRAQELSIELMGMPPVTWNLAALCNACTNKHHAPIRWYTSACEGDLQSKMKRSVINSTTTQIRLPEFGGEASYECVLRVKSDQSKRISSAALYYQLLTEDETRLEEWGFSDVHNYLGLPTNFRLGKTP